MSRHLIALIFTFALTCGAVAQTDEQPNTKAKKYHNVLVKRPKPGTLFDRFYNAWLDTGTLAGLEEFLKNDAETGKTTGQRLLLAFFYAKQRDNVRSIEQFRAALEDDPGNAEAWYEKAKIEAKTLDFDTAIADLDKAAAGNPTEDMTIEIAKMQGKLHLRGGATETALEVWKQLLSDHPGDEELREDLIELQVTEGLYEEAVATAKDLAESTKDVYKKVIRQMRLGDIHQRANDREKALEAYSSTLNQVGHGTWIEKEILAQIEQVHRREENMTGLDNYYQKLIETDSKRIRLRQRHAAILTELGDKDRAMKAYDEILSLTPGERSYREAYVDMLASFQDYDKAITQQEQLTKAYPDDGELVIKLAGLYHAKKDKEKTTATLQRYLEASDKSEYAYLRTARLFERYLMNEEADTIYQALTEAHPESNAAHEAYAAFLHKQDKAQQAIGIWTRMAAGAPRSELVRVARSLSTRREFQAAFDLLHARFDEFATDPIFLGELCTLAAALERHAEAVPWARRAVQLAASAFDLEAAISQFAKISGQADQTINSINELLKQDPRLLNDTCLLAELLEREGDSTKAEEVLNAVDTAKPEDAMLVLSQKIRIFRQRNEWLAAADTMTQLIELPGGRKSVHVQSLIELYRKAFRLEQALPWVAEWKKLSPGSTQPWITEARLLNEQEKFDESVDVLRRAVQQFEGNDQIRAELANIYAEQGKMADADRMYWNLYEEAEELADKLTWVKALATTAQAQGKIDQLVDSFEERRASNRASILPLLALAELHRVTSNYEGRRRALLEATRMRPEDVSLLHEIARIEQAENDWQGAIKTLESAIPLDKTDKTLQKIAQIHLSNGDDEEGFRILQQIAGGDQMDSREVESVADAMLGSYHFDRAIEFLAPFVEKFPDDYRIGYLYAVCLEEEWRTDAALAAFGRLLSIKQEISGLKSAKSYLPGNLVNSQHRYLAEMEAWVPAPVLDLIRHSSFDYHRAYMHRQNNRRYRGTGWGSSSSMSSNVALPDNVDALSSFVMPHLGVLIEDVEEDERTDIYRALQEKGIGYPKLMLQLASNQGRQQFDYEALFEENPEDEILLGFWILRGTYGHWDDDIAQRGFATFKKTYPQLALSLAFHPTAINSENGGKLLEEGIALLAEIEQPGSNVTSLIARTLSQASAPNAGATLSEEQQKLLTDKLLAWHPKLDDNAKNQVFYSVANALRQHDDLAPFFKLLDEELARIAEAQQGKGTAQSYNSMMYAYFGHNNNQTLIRPLPFPPPLHNLGSHIMTMVTPLPNQNYYQNLAELEPEKIEPLLNAIQHPTLKILAAYQAENYESAAAWLDELVAAEDPEVDSFILAAAYAADQGELEKAGGLLNKASYLPLDRSTRSMLDASLLAWALDAETDSALRELGKSAALRLRRQMLNPEQRSQLADAMETLGMEDEALKLLAKGKMSPGATGAFMGGSVGGGIRYSGSRNRQQRGRVEQLIMDDRFDQAIETSAQQLRRHASTYLMPQNMDNSFYDSRDIVNPIRAHSLTEDVLQAADPGENVSARRLAQYAMVCQVLGKLEQAYELFKKVVEERPKDEGARMRLFLLAAENHPDEAAGHLLKIRPQVLGSLGYGIQNLIGNTQDFDQRLAIVDVIKVYLENLEDTEKVDLSWVMQVANQLGQAYYNGNIQLPSLYARRDDTYRNDNIDEEEREAMIKQRREAHDAFCKIMLDIPQLTLEGFRRFASPAIHDGAEPDNLAELAKGALLDYKPFRNSRYGSTYYSHNENEIRFYTPENYLVEHAWKNSNLELLTDELIPALTQAKRTQEATRLERQVSLFQCEPDKFVEIADEAVSKPANPGNYNDINQAMAMVVDVWKLRDLDVSLDEVLLDQLKKSMGRNSPSSTLSNYTVALLEQGHSDRAHAFFEGVAEAFLGPEDKRAAFIEKHYVPNSWSSNTPNGNIHQYQNLLSEFGRNPNLTFMAMEQFEAADFAKYNRHSSPINHFRSSSVLRDAEAVLTLFKVSPWLGNPDTLRFFMEDSNRGQVFLLSLLSNLTSDTYEDARTGLLDHLEKLEPALGVKLIQGYFSKQPEAMADALGEHADAIRALPEERREIFAILARSLFPDDSKLEKASDQAKALVEELRDLKQLGPDEEIASYLEKIAKPTVQHQNIDLVDECKRLLNLWFRVHPDDPDKIGKADEIFNATVDAIAKSKRNGTWRRNYGSDVTEAGRILYYLTNNSADLNRNTIVFSLRQLAKPLASGLEIEIDNYLLRQVGSGMATMVNNAVKTEEITPNSLQHYQLAHQLFSDLLPAEPGALVISGLLELFSGVSEVTGEELMAWLNSLPVDENPFTREMLMALRFHEGLRTLAAEVEERAEATNDEAADVPVEMLHYIAHLENHERPLTWRLALSYALLDATQVKPPGYSREPLARVAAPLLAAGWANRVTTVKDEQATVIMSSFLKIADHDEVWTAVGADIAQAWLRSQMQQANSRYNRTPNTDTLNQIMELCLATKAEQPLNRIISQHAPELGRDASPLMILVKSGEYARAGSLLRKSWQDMQPSYNNQTFDEQMHQHLAPFLESIDKEELRYFAEVVIGNCAEAPAQKEEGQDTKDATVDPEPKADQRRQRLEAAAAKFGELEFSNKLLRERCLSILASDFSTTDHLKDVLAEAANELDLEALLEIDDSRLREQRMKIIGSHISHAAGQGNTKPFDDAIAIAENASRRGNQYYRRQAVDQLCDDFMTGLRAQWGSLTEEVQRSTLPTIRKIAFLPKKQRSQTRSKYLPVAILTHAYLDGLDTLDRSLDSMSEGDRQDVENNAVSGSSNEFFSAAADILNHEKVPLEKRLSALMTAANHEIYGTFISGRTTFLASVANKVITEEEIVAKADELLLMLPDKYATADAISRIAGDLGQVEPALKLSNIALCSASTSNVQTSLFFRKAALLTKHGRRPEAMLALASIATPTLNENQEKTWQKEHGDLVKAMQENGEESDVLQIIAARISESDSDIDAWRALSTYYHGRGLSAAESEQTTAAKAWFQLSAYVSQQAAKRQPDQINVSDLMLSNWLQAKRSLGELEDIPLLVERGAVWRYLDDGSDQEDAWRSPEFDDTEWESGPAQLGYGDGDEATKVASGRSGRRHITTYFRHRFETNSSNDTGVLLIDLIRDDGVVVYLNGEELTRDGMPSGKIDHRRLASHSVSGVDEDAWVSKSVRVKGLVNGENVIAAEVHQTRTTSSDISFDFELSLLPSDPEQELENTNPEAVFKGLSTSEDPGLSDAILDALKSL